MIPLYKSTLTGNELEIIGRESEKLPAGFHSNIFHEWCTNYFSKFFPECKLFFTSSCSRALELAIALADIQIGDEVILPSFTYVASANAIVQKGGVPVFVDINPDHPNINHELVEAAITTRTKAIMPVHYAGVACEMDSILAIAKKHNLLVIEDAAHAIGAKYKNQYLGGLGDFGCLSFDKMKNVSCGEGGLLVIKNQVFFERAYTLFENGTDRSLFLMGQVPFFQWSDAGSNYKLSTICAAVLFAQLVEFEKISGKRIDDWNYYLNGLLRLEADGYVELPKVSTDCWHNAHIFYIKLKTTELRNDLIEFLRKQEIESAFHFTPLHSSKYGKMASRFHGEDCYTTSNSGRLLRLPLYYQISKTEMNAVIEAIYDFFTKKNPQ